MSFLKRYKKHVLILCGLLITLWFGLKFIQAITHPPQEPERPAAAATGSLESRDIKAPGVETSFERKSWSGQVAKQGFLTLIGLFLALLGIVPRKLVWVPKLTFSSGLVGLIVFYMLAQGEITTILKQGIRISAAWLLLGLLVKAFGMGCTVWRWRVLLAGQGYRIPLRHVVEAFLIGRFIGSFSPGTSGLDGYRIYDIARYTGDTSKSLSVILVEKVIGFFVLGTLLLASIPVGAALFAERSVNTSTVLGLGVIFFGVTAASVMVLFMPGLLRRVATLLLPPAGGISKAFHKLISAVSAYEHEKARLLKATLIGFGVHLASIGVYLCTARAIGVTFPIDYMFATGALMIGATVLPLSIAGIGMREGVFAFFLGPIAAVFAFLGYLVEEAISVLGGPIWLLRKADYYEVIAAQRQQVEPTAPSVVEAGEAVPSASLAAASGEPTKPYSPPDVADYVMTGAGAGLIAGLVLGLIETLSIIVFAADKHDLSVFCFAALTYGIACGLGGACLALFGYGWRRIDRVSAPDRLRRWVFVFMTFLAGVGFIIVRFKIYRDVFNENVPMMSPKGILVQLGLLVALLGVFVLGRYLILNIGRRVSPRAFSLPMNAAFYGLVTLACLALSFTGGEPPAKLVSGRAAQGKPDIFLIHVDTLRPDHVGSYGSTLGLTPNMDAFARDAVVFRNAFAQSSWTRPSVATVFTGRFPSSHKVMYKNDALPNEVVTLAEALSGAGYATGGLVANFNLAPYFNYQQGFQEYTYIEPDLLLWADDNASKLALYSIFRLVHERLGIAKLEPRHYYLEAEKMTVDILAWLDRTPPRPFFHFSCYMDPHDPYFRHPFDGTGIARVANPNPPESMLPEIRALYAGEVKYFDEHFGRLLQGLKQRGLYDDSLIVLYSDHGEELHDHDGWWHGTTLYDEQVRVVLMVKFPGKVQAGLQEGSWMRLVDVMPFILANVGVPIPPGVQGRPEPDPSQLPVYGEEDHEGNRLSSLRYMKDGREMKLILANPGNPRGLLPEELYNLSSDPSERQEISASDRPSTSDGRKLLVEQAVQASKGAVKSSRVGLDEDAAARLNALGYAGK